MSYPCKMKRAWIEKSCKNILASEVKKLSLDDLIQIEANPRVSKFLKTISIIAKTNKNVLTDSKTFKKLLLLILTSNPFEDDTATNSFDNFQFVYTKIFSEHQSNFESSKNITHFLKILQKGVQTSFYI